jgi:Spy/CpxP family protein refolding chaperone
MRRLLLVTLVLAWLMAPLSAIAEDGPIGHPKSRAEAMKRLEMVRLYKLVEVLELSSEESARLFPVVQKFDEQFRQIVEKTEKAYLELHKTVVAENPDPEKLEQLVNEILQNERAALKVRGAQYTELKKVLSPERCAKYLLFEKSFQREMHRILNDVRGKRKMRRTRGVQKPGE